MEDINNRPFSRDVHLIGADYTIKDTHHYKGSKRRRLFASTGSAPDTGVAYQAGISTFVYATIPGTPDPTDVIGVRAQVFPDILAAYHYPNLSDGNHGDSDLPLSDGQFTRVSRTKTRSEEYSVSTLGIGQTVYHSGDNDYAGAVGVVTSQSSLGYFYFFGGTEDSNGIGANINNVSSGAQSQISGLIDDIDALRTNLRIRIGPPQVANSAGINTLRESKHRDELEVWYDEAGDRTRNIIDFQGGMDALVEKLHKSRMGLIEDEAEYWEMKAEIHYGI